MSTTKELIKRLLYDPCAFSAEGSKIKLRPYQSEVIERIVDSVINEHGDTIVVQFPRQSGKNETQAALETYLLVLLALFPRQIVKFSPTWKPQSQNAMRRLERTLNRNILTATHWRKREGYIFQVGEASCMFFTAEPTAHVVGATADLLLEVDEAQDVSIEKYDKEILPMIASTNATRVLWGTAWTGNTLLARERKAAAIAEKEDGRRRVFVLNADQVRHYVPAYGRHVDQQVARLGRQHPSIKTQYFSEEIDELTGMFPAARRALMKGDQYAHDSPVLGAAYVFCLDVAGQDEAAMAHPGQQTGFSADRDSISLTIFSLDLASLETLQAPIYRAVKRCQWTGENHVSVFGKLKALADSWLPQYIVIDATGVGEGLWAMLDKAYPNRVLPVKFSAPKKSEIGYRFISIIETGRFRDCSPSAEVERQYAACQAEILPGPQHTMRWGVPDGTRDDRGLVHDDYVLADALIAEIDMLDWSLPTKPLIAPRIDPLTEMDGAF